MKNQASKTYLYFFITLLFVLAIGERLFFDLGPNIELITPLIFISSIYLGYFGAMFLGLFALGITDSFIGINSIYLFTWSAFIIEAFMFSKFSKKNSFKKRKTGFKLFFSLGAGLGASLFFYFFTNFGVWFLGGWNIYPQNLSGLISCYVAGLPFLKLSLISNLIFLPSFVFLFELGKVKAFLRSKKLSMIRW